MNANQKIIKCIRTQIKSLSDANKDFNKAYQEGNTAIITREMKGSLGKDYILFKLCNVDDDQFIKIDYKYIMEMKEDGNNPLKYILEIPLYLGMGNGFWLISKWIEIFAICFVILAETIAEIKNIKHFFEILIFLSSKVKFRMFEGNSRAWPNLAQF